MPGNKGKKSIFTTFILSLFFFELRGALKPQGKWLSDLGDCSLSPSLLDGYIADFPEVSCPVLVSDLLKCVGESMVVFTPPHSCYIDPQLANKMPSLLLELNISLIHIFLGKSKSIKELRPEDLFYRRKGWLDRDRIEYRNSH